MYEKLGVFQINEILKLAIPFFLTEHFKGNGIPANGPFLTGESIARGITLEWFKRDKRIQFMILLLYFSVYP